MLVYDDDTTTNNKGELVSVWRQLDQPIYRTELELSDRTKHARGAELFEILKALEKLQIEKKKNNQTLHAPPISERVENYVP